MSVSYNINSTINLSYAEDTIKNILVYGIQQGFVYLDDDWVTILSINEVLQKVFYYDREKDTCHIMVKFVDTIFFLWFFKAENDLLIVCMGSFGYVWEKDFSNGERKTAIDFMRYIRLMLGLCKYVALLELTTSTDYSNYLVYNEGKYVTALVNLGLFAETKSNGFMNGGTSSIRYFLYNIMQNNMILLDQDTNLDVKSFVNRNYEILTAGFSMYLYAKKDDTSFKIEVKRDEQHGYDCVSVHPLEPYRMKKDHSDGKGQIDAAFYIERLLEVCENFAIDELKTFL